MPAITDITKQNLDQFGLKGFGFTMPVSTKKWCNASGAAISGTITFAEDELALNITGANNWLAPLSATAAYVNTTDNKITATLNRGDGSVVNEEGWFCSLFPQQFLRLKRLVAKKFEVDNAHNPQKANGIPLRQVPKYYFIAKASQTPTVKNGMINVGDDFGCGGKLQFFDENGYIIHPLYVAGIIKALLASYTALELDSSLDDQLSNIVTLNSTNDVTVRLIKEDGTPYDGTHLQGITAKNASIGLFTVNNYTGTETTTKGEITRAADTGTTGNFLKDDADRLVFSLVTYGRAGSKVSLPKSDAAITLNHDFFTVKVTQLKTYLLGAPNTAFNGTKLEPKPVVRINEQLNMIADGNDLMGKVTDVFTGTLTDSFLVAPHINAAFPLPQNATDTHWPAFPALPGGLTADDAAFMPTVKTEITKASTAVFITALVPQPSDVQLTIVGVPKGAAVRVYNRMFGNDAVLSRGDGGGGVAATEAPADPANPRTFNGQCVITLINPLGILRLDGTTVVPQSPKLIFDLVILERSGKTRMFGAIEIPVAMPSIAAPAAPAANAANAAAKQGVCNAAILGFDTHGIKGISSVGSIQDLANLALTLFGNTSPRDAPRWPTMCRRDLIIAAKSAANWNAVIGGGPYIQAMHSADPRNGCPGSLGGRETNYTAVGTKNALLAYDIARMGFRRTTYLIDRLTTLADNSWNEPAANTPLAETATSTDTIGTFAGTILQNIAPYCETPELALLKLLVEAEIDNIPTDFNALVDKVTGWLNGLSTSSLPSPLSTALNALKSAGVTQLNNLKTNATGLTASRLYTELKRELSSACYGRRDSQWALQAAIKRARQFIYIETPGISFTQDTSQNYAVDLIALIGTQIQANPGLKVIICTPKKPDYHPSYDQWIRKEIEKRYALLVPIEPKQLVCFHPVGFPGRPANIESNVVIVDDQWALVGSSAFRRRGLTFDGSADVVFTDCETLNGISPSIKNFRVNLLKKRLGKENIDQFDPDQNLINDGSQSFYLIRETSIAGGLGKIERLWNGYTDGVEYSAPTIDGNLVNPDGLEFSALAGIVNAAFTGLAT